MSTANESLAECDHNKEDLKQTKRKKTYIRVQWNINQMAELFNFAKAKTMDSGLFCALEIWNFLNMPKNK
jgi:hypothetical protein